MFNSPNIEFLQIFNEAIPVMERETKDFCKNHLNEINGQQFWNKMRFGVAKSSMTTHLISYAELIISTIQ